ncbi:histidine phosphatase family protein [Defluviimonas sp. WL0024]|uniref:Histidine phosphatase family protein n=1 Tax=Albidovulum salinarum TaxID=2984153 RepID=A0ABT2X8U6_9RHOB|nr:histidine phosphatase family protein [Defluviimonas sp. WL0024]MCU9849412.1 histidine phosphatase family protein [Defluviimonas sp. WL0024]
MKGGAATELILIRHAPALSQGKLCGRTDVPADCGDVERIEATRAALGTPDRIVVSPALRCRQTAAALWPDLAEPELDAALWEQDFGDWEGRPYAELPDLGPLPPAELADHRPPRGESFADLCARVAPALRRAASGGRVAVVAHAGTARAALALALGNPAQGLAFEIAPLSVTRLRLLEGGGWSVIGVNWVPG